MKQIIQNILSSYDNVGDRKELASKIECVESTLRRIQNTGRGQIAKAQKLIDYAQRSNRLLRLSLFLASISTRQNCPQIECNIYTDESPRLVIVYSLTQKNNAFFEDVAENCNCESNQDTVNGIITFM